MERRQTPAQKGEHVLDAAPKTNAINLAGRVGSAEMRLTTATDGAPSDCRTLLNQAAFCKPRHFIYSSKGQGKRVGSVRTGGVFLDII